MLVPFISGLAALVTFIIFIIDMVIFGTVYKCLRAEGAQVQYGNANWLTLGALVALLLGFCGSTCSSYRNYRKKYPNGC